MGKKRNIIIISHYANPEISVGVRRILYWATHLGDYGFNVVFVTAKGSSYAENRGFRVFEVENKGKSIFSPIIKDEGLTWRNGLRDFFSNYEEDIDLVLFSGGPFFHFGLAGHLRKRFGCRIVFDFRDPFSNNPRFEDPAWKILVKRFFERRFLSNANGLITVNPYCEGLIIPNALPGVIIDNGYDETYFTDKPGKKKNSLIYTGKIYDDFRIDDLAGSIQGMPECSFSYFGPDAGKFGQVTTINLNGQVDYSQVVSELLASEVGVILTGGKPFESTTKIFDYIGAGLKILIITEGEPRTGNIHSITEHNPNVEWARNTQKEILEATSRLLNREYIPVNKAGFARSSGLKVLVKFLNELDKQD